MVTFCHVVIASTVLSKVESKIKSGEGLLAPFFPCLMELLVVLQAHAVLLWRLRHEIINRSG